MAPEQIARRPALAADRPVCRRPAAVRAARGHAGLWFDEPGRTPAAADGVAKPPLPPSVRATIDPRIVQVIDRCLEPDAARRPESALRLAAALPGGDPLAAALAAGETPAPHVVADAADEHLLSPAAALACLIAFAAAVVALLAVHRRQRLLEICRLPPVAGGPRREGRRNTPASRIRRRARRYRARIHGPVRNISPGSAPGRPGRPIGNISSRFARN